MLPGHCQYKKPLGIIKPVKNIYLTIDDVPSADFAAKVNYLKANKIPAALFCIGRQVAGHEQELIGAVQAGFVLGNHSYTHAKFSELSTGQAEDEIRRTDLLIDGLYRRADVVRPVKLFRFPYGDRGGDKAPQVQAVLKDYGYTLPGLHGINYSFYAQHIQNGFVDMPWTFNVMEYQFKSPDDIKKRLNTRHWPLGVDLPQDGGYLGSDSAEIVIVHDHTDTSDLFEPIITALQPLGRYASSWMYGSAESDE
jgi:peptidoglycan-N-acetylglucosamine deacetylase